MNIKMAVLVPMVLGIAGCSNSTSSSTFYFPSIGRDLDRWYEDTREAGSRRDSDQDNQSHHNDYEHYDADNHYMQDDEQAMNRDAYEHNDEHVLFG